MHKPPPVILWFRSDLRLSDHPALAAAIASGQPVLPVYILEDDIPWPMGGASRWWLHHSLTALSADLQRRGAPLLLRRGDPAEILPALMHDTGADALHAGQVHEPAGRNTEAALAKRLGDRFHLHRTASLFDLDSVRTKTGGVYGVYTPFSRACRARTGIGEPLPPPAEIAGVKPPQSDHLADWDLLPRHPDWAGGIGSQWQPGEVTALERLAAFLENAVARYKTGRNLPGEDGTSRLSPHLHWGELSPRQVWHAAGALPPGDGLDTFLGEILWREFAAYLLWHQPHLPDQPLRPAFANLPVRHEASELAAWQRGQTGVPIVDAGMRQLWQRGWMHNRVRMIAASFLVKQLLIDWRDGERWFWDTLVDADLASNAASWQWIAGCGIDAQPFFRVFNPVTQGTTWDKAGAYVRHYVPELAALPEQFLHAPWTAPAPVLAKAGVTLGTTYPQPLVELGPARQRALDAYRDTVRKHTA